MIDTTKDAADLYWLAFLLTGRRDISIDIAVDTGVSQAEAGPFYPSWMRSRARRLVIAKALAAVRDELAASARRTELAHVGESAAPARGWSLPPQTTKAKIEGALLAIDVFPRAALLLMFSKAYGLPTLLLCWTRTPRWSGKRRPLR